MRRRGKDRERREREREGVEEDVGWSLSSSDVWIKEDCELFRERKKEWETEQQLDSKHLKTRKIYTPLEEALKVSNHNLLILKINWPIIWKSGACVHERERQSAEGFLDSAHLSLGQMLSMCCGRSVCVSVERLIKNWAVYSFILTGLFIWNPTSDGNIVNQTWRIKKNIKYYCSCLF